MIPKLRQRHGVLSTRLVECPSGGIWHLPVFVVNSGDATGALDPSLMVPATVLCLVVLPVVRVPMVRAADRTDGVLVSILMMHASLTGSVGLRRSSHSTAALPMSVGHVAFVAANGFSRRPS